MIPILHLFQKLFQKTQEGSIFPNPFYETSITLAPNQTHCNKRKPKTIITDEERYKKFLRKVEHMESNQWGSFQEFKIGLTLNNKCSLLTLLIY